MVVLLLLVLVVVLRNMHTCMRVTRILRKREPGDASRRPGN